MNCGQACPYNTLDGCKVKVYNGICPLSNMATPITEIPMTNADKIRAMSDRELASFMAERTVKENCLRLNDEGYQATATQIAALHEKLFQTWMRWLQQPAEDSL